MTHTQWFGLKIRPNRSHRCSGADGRVILAPNLLPRLVFEGFGLGFGFFLGCCLNYSVNRFSRFGRKMFGGQNWTHTWPFGLKIRPSRSHRCSGSDGMVISMPNPLPRVVFNGFGVEFGFFRGCCLNYSVNRVSPTKGRRCEARVKWQSRLGSVQAAPSFIDSVIPMTTLWARRN